MLFPTLLLTSLILNVKTMKTWQVCTCVSDGSDALDKLYVVFYQRKKIRIQQDVYFYAGDKQKSQHITLQGVNQTVEQ